MITFIHPAVTNNIVIKLHQGLAFHNAGKLEEAQSIYKQILIINPKNFDALQLSGAIEAQLKQYEKAFELVTSALKINNANASVHNNLAVILRELKRFNEALASCDRSIELKSDFADAYLNRGIVLQELNRLQEALVNYERAIELNRNSWIAYSNRGNVLKELGFLDDALLSCNKAIELNCEFSEAYYNRGNILLELNRLDEALQSYDKSIELKLDFAAAFYHRGNALTALNRLDEAFLSYEKANKLDPYLQYLFGTLLHTKMRLCNWQDYEANIECLKLKITQGHKVSPSLSVLALTDSLAVQRKTSETWMNDKHPLNLTLGLISKSSRKKKIKLGYFSSDFREHPVAYLTAELFELHDKNQFELIGFYFGPPDFSIMHNRISSAFNKFIDVQFTSDKDVAQMSRDIGIDIAIDLTGLTKDNRVGIFSYRAAPVQLSYLGYLGTMGVEYYDYLKADKTLIPAGSHRHYKEKIVYLPSYQVNDSKRLIAKKYLTKAELNLPEDKFVFCCFNSNYKITPPTFDVWMKILKAVPDSILFLYSENKWAENNLKFEAVRRGVNQTRLIFGPVIKRSEYIARYRLADLFLDTLPYNAGTTASDALWAGLPVLTCMGESFASRVAASLLNAVELPQLITNTYAQYEAKAIELATNPAELNDIREKLQNNKLTKALFDTPRFTKNIESAFTKMYERYQTNLAPEHIYIEA